MLNMNVFVQTIDWFGDLGSQLFEQLQTSLGAAQLGGALLILIAFYLVSKEKVRPTSFAYLSLNLVGASLLVLTAIIPNVAAGFLFLNSVWVIVAVIGFVKLAQTRAKKKAAPQEKL